MNIILICLDSLRRDHLGVYGNDWIKTPHLDKFGRENIVFENFYPNGIPTLPFRRGLMQGRRVHPFKETKPLHPRNHITLLGWHGLIEDHITIQEVLQQNDYTTSFITDVAHMFAPDVNFHIGFDSYQFLRGNECDKYLMGGSRGNNLDKYLVKEVRGTIQERYLTQSMLALDRAKSEEDFFSPSIFRTACNWLESNARYYENFYLHIDSFDPHEPWYAPREYRYMYDPDYSGKEIVLPQPIMENMTEAEANHIRALYAGKITMVDRWFGHFMEKFKNMGLDKDTAVIVLSDHGHPLGEHKYWRKCPPALYHTMLDNFMMISLPQSYQRHGERPKAFVHEYDLAPTLLSLSGITPPESMNGSDFSRVLTGESDAHREYAAGGYNTYAYIRDNDYFYRLNLAAPEDIALFDLKADPGQKNNLAGSLPETEQLMHKMLERELDGWKLPEKLGDSGYLNAYKPNYIIRDDAWTSIYD